MGCIAALYLRRSSVRPTQKVEKALERNLVLNKVIKVVASLALSNGWYPAKSHCHRAKGGHGMEGVFVSLFLKLKLLVIAQLVD